MYRVSIVAASLIALGSVALAGRPVTDGERAKLVAAIAAQGCSGGKMMWDDTHFEVDEAVCSDGRRYDLKFDAAFKLVDKRLER